MDSKIYSFAFNKVIVENIFSKLGLFQVVAFGI